MEKRQLSNHFRLLALCAILRDFDRDLLVALAPEEQAGITALLASELIAPSQPFPNTHRLRSPIQADVLRQLRFSQHVDEVALHISYLEFLLGRLHSPTSATGVRQPEDECFYHLEQLFLLQLTRLDWQTLLQYTRAVSEAIPQLTFHEQTFMFYEAYVLIRTQKYEHGELMLTTLLDQPSLELILRQKVLLGLAHANWFQTRYDRALIFYQQLLEVARQTGDRIYEGIALLNINTVYHELDLYEQAMDYCIRSLKIFREQGEYSREAQALYQIGVNAMYLGRWQIAQQHFDQAAKLYEALRLDVGLPALYWCQGFLHHLLGDELRSEEAYVRAIPLVETAAQSQPSVAMDLWWGLGFLYRTQGRFQEALTAFGHATIFARSLGHEHRLSQLHFERGKALKLQGRPYEAFEEYRLAIEVSEAIRGAAEEEEIKIGLVGTMQQLYESMVLLCLDLDRFEDAFNYVERARSRAFLDSLMKRAPELHSTLDQPVADLREVQANLPEGALVLEYFATGVIPRGENLVDRLPRNNARLRQHLTVPPAVLLFAVTRDHFEMHRVPLDPNTLRPLPGDPGPGRRFVLRPRLLALLYERLIEPVEALMFGQSHIFLIPHGPLHYVPFMALQAANGRFLLDRSGPTIALAPSATILLRNCFGRPSSRSNGLLAVGFNGTGDDELRYAEVEAQLVARLVDGEAWIGPEHKSEQLAEPAKYARWLHFAGHAEYNPYAPFDSSLRLGAADSLAARTIMSRLDLSADLVTLSACTSGLSHVVPGDELLGLQRAFLYAGVPSVVCTLWEAYDLVSLLLMEQFYIGLRQGNSPGAALRDAQVAIREMTGRDLAATFERWRAQYPEYVATLIQAPLIQAEHPDRPVFEDPLYWAPYMLIGRA